MTAPERSAQPRAGLPGLIDRYLGPEATPLDRVRVVLAAIGGALLGLLTIQADWWARLLLMVVSAELCAGLMAQLNHAGKAWTHRPHQRTLRLVGFLLVQGLPLYVFVLLMRADQPELLLSANALLYIGAAAILLTPPAWQRAIGLVALLAVMFTLQSLHGLPQEAAWFLPLFYARTFLAKLPGPREPDAQG